MKKFFLLFTFIIFMPSVLIAQRVTIDKNQQDWVLVFGTQGANNTVIPDTLKGSSGVLRGYVDVSSDRFYNLFLDITALDQTGADSVGATIRYLLNWNKDATDAAANYYMRVAQTSGITLATITQADTSNSGKHYIDFHSITTVVPVNSRILLEVTATAENDTSLWIARLVRGN